MSRAAALYCRARGQEPLTLNFPSCSRVLVRAYFIYLFILRVTVEKYFLSANAELQLDFPSGNCNMEDSDFGLSFANNTMQMLSFKDRSHFSEDEQQTGAGKSPIIYFPDI